MSIRWLPSSPEEARRVLAQEVGRALALRQDPRPWMEASLWLRDKGRQVIPFRLNRPQQRYYQQRTPRDLILKARQMGFSTLVCGLFFADCLLRPHTTSVIVAHDYDSAERLFRIVQLFWERLPGGERRRAGDPGYSNRRKLFWPKLNSHFYVLTAQSVSAGRGMTISNLHCSEFAFWPRPEESLAALTQAVPQGGRIVIESTPNGIGNYFHQLWQRARSGEAGFRPHFFPWFESEEYRIPVTEEERRHIQATLTAEEIELVRNHSLWAAQVNWRRQKMQDLGALFRQEYPENDLDCFLASTRAVFDLQALGQMAARIAVEPQAEIVAALPLPDGRSLPVAPARLLVWQRPQPEATYVVGADVGEGLPDGDASCAIVLERRSGEQVAELHGRVSPERFAHLLDALGKWYHRAQLAVERNNHGHSTLNNLRHVCHYPRLYYHVRYDARAGAQPILGWPTDQSTKPILVDDLAAAISQGAVRIRSRALIDELMTFVVTETGSQEAQPGCHDDRVIALGIAWQVRKRPLARWTAQRPEGW